jgi:hydroxymethylbilane synthase
VEDSLPAAGQAALGIECLAARADLIELLQPLQEVECSACVRAERAVNLSLGGSCTIPLGAFAEMAGRMLKLRALVASPDGRRIARAEAVGDASAPEALGLRVADALRREGAEDILAALVP